MKFKLTSLLLIFLISFKSRKGIDFCGNNSIIESITKLSNGSLFLTSGQFYWILSKNNEWYEWPTHQNAKSIVDILPNVDQIDSVETIVNFNSFNDHICHSNEELLMFYWVKYILSSKSID